MDSKAKKYQRISYKTFLDRGMLKLNFVNDMILLLTVIKFK